MNDGSEEGEEGEDEDEDKDDDDDDLLFHSIYMILSFEYIRICL